MAHTCRRQFFLVRAREVTRHISGSARGGLRSGVAVDFDSTSTMLNQTLNGDARRRSGSSCKLRPLRDPHSNDRRHSFDRVSLPFATALSDCLQTWTGTRSAGRSVCPSRSGREGRGAAQREREGHPIKTRECRATTLFLVPVVPSRALL